jgi:transglutaminase-like putative cysteine protease
MSFVEDSDIAAPIDIGGADAVEVLVRPRDLSRGNDIGDCDDYTGWTAALLEANGIPCTFCTVAADARDPARYSHIYVVAYLNGVRVPMDCSHGQYPGWESPVAYRKREWPVRSAQGSSPARECDWLMWLSVAMSAFSLYKLLTGARA